ncbi:MAG: 2,3-bisphosphoglycerate-independent phosphoglycerate mutase [Rickettsiales bacterium]
MKKVLLCILDGMGIAKSGKYNAVSLANTPNYNYLLQNCPHSALDACGEAVGLPVGQMGNSEVGHITIGAGRVIYQDLPRISKAFAQNQVKLDVKGDVHLVGLCSDGGVHSHINHILALGKLLHGNKVYVHMITDGRDTPPQSALKYLDGLNVATISGRFYAMDRDKRWERTDAAFEAIIKANGAEFNDPATYINSSYQNGVNDEFIIPGIAAGYQGFKDGDTMIFCNFRADRMRQFAAKFLEAGFSKSRTIAMTEYSQELAEKMEVLFKNEQPKNVLGEVIAAQGFKQFRIAETEKYAHVTYFLNGGREALFTGEDRVMIPSPKVATYDLKPEMSAFEVAEKVVAAVQSNNYALIVVNFANPDMVGHSGNVAATIKAVEAVDKCLGQIMIVCKAANHDLLVTADHGNAEELYDENNHQPLTSHSMNKVPFIYYGSQLLQLKDGSLADISPSILKLLGVAKPDEMTGLTLF